MKAKIFETILSPSSIGNKSEELYHKNEDSKDWLAILLYFLN